MKCSNCGSDLSEGSRFCPVCGQKVVGNYSYQPEDDLTMDASYDQYQTQAAPGYQGNYQSGYQSGNQTNYQSNYQGNYQNGYQNNTSYQQGYSVSPNSDNNNGNNSNGIKILLILGIILLVFAVGVLIYLLVGRQGSSDSNIAEVSQDASGNNADGSVAAEGTTDDSPATTEATTQAAGTTTQATTEASSATTATNTTGTYILPDSTSRYLTTSDLSPLSSWELKLARNEIYARHGRKFDNSDVQAYFDSQSWYYGYIEPGNFDESVFNTYESANVAFIKQYENGTAPSSAASVNSGSSSSGSGSSSSGSTSSEYILPNSSTTYLSYSDIAGLSKSQLRLARNEIYARHGRKFNDSDLQAYFNSKSWYVGYIDADDFDESLLSAVEKSNIDLIKSYE